MSKIIFEAAMPVTVEDYNGNIRKTTAQDQLAVIEATQLLLKIFKDNSKIEV